MEREIRENGPGREQRAKLYERASTAAVWADEQTEDAMAVNAELTFDVCWEVYRGAREILETKRGVGALD